MLDDVLLLMTVLASAPSHLSRLATPVPSRPSRWQDCATGLSEASGVQVTALTREIVFLVKTSGLVTTLGVLFPPKSSP